MSISPYLIVAPPWRGNSGGIRVVHLLCHHLNERGYLAYILTSGINPSLNTPLAPMDSPLPADAIVIYPEVVSGNPLNARRVVRYVLNRPGLIGGDKTYPASELCFAYSEQFAEYAPKGNILTVPPIERDLFCLPPEDTKRDIKAYYIGKGINTPKIPQTKGLTEITHSWPGTRTEVADLLKRCDILYSYDVVTGLTTEARLCGCPAILIPDPLLPSVYEENKKLVTGFSGGGLGWGIEEEQKAKDTVKNFPAIYDKFCEDFDIQLTLFIKKTQNHRYK